MFAKPEVWRFPFGRGLTTQETHEFLQAQLDHWSSSGFGLWLAVERSTATAVGFIGLSVPTFLPEVLPAVEVGWRLDPIFWGRGYATEGAGAALDEAFATLGLPVVVSIPQSDNAPSVAVAVRLGMRLDRSVVIPATTRRGPLDAKLFEITREAWNSDEATPSVLQPERENPAICGASPWAILGSNQ